MNLYLMLQTLKFNELPFFFTLVENFLPHPKRENVNWNVVFGHDRNGFRSRNINSSKLS